MKTYRKLLTVAALATGLFVSSSAQAAGFAIYEAGTRQLGMAGAFTAIADDPSAIFFNPAGLALQKGFSAQANIALIAPTFAYDTATPTGADTTIDAKNLLFFVPSIYANYSVHDRVAVGFGMYAPAGLGVEWPASFNVNGADTPWWGRSIIEEIHLQVVNLNASVSFKLHDRVYIGGGFVVGLGAVTLKRAVTMSNDPADDITVDLSGDDIGFGGTAGLLVKILPGLLNFGFTYKSAMSFEFTGDAAFTRAGGVPAALRTRLLDGPVSAPLTLPHTFSFGLTGFPMERLLVSFNFDYVTWSTYENLSINFTDNPALNTTEYKGWENVFQLRLGAEYKVLKDNLPVRLGFIYDKSPAPDETVGPELPDTDRYWFALGVGYTTPWKVSFDLAYQFLITGDDKTAATAPIVGSRSAGAHIVSLGVGYRL